MDYIKLYNPNIYLDEYIILIYIFGLYILIYNNMYIIIGFIVTIFIYLFLSYYINYNKISIENFNNNIYFLDNNELFNILTSDNDNYFKSFLNNDFISRKINNINEYFINIKMSVTDFNDNEIKKIKSCIENINLKLLNIDLLWFNGKKAYEIPWKIGCIKGKLYENGLPHTRDDVIVLSKDHVNDYSIKKLMKTLMHEKVHVYQKIYKIDVEKYIKMNNFTKLKERSIQDNIRANPDLDNWVYRDSSNNVYRAIYNDNPSSIEDITYLPFNSQSYEHPFEKMAIYIETNFI